MYTNGQRPRQLTWVNGWCTKPVVTGSSPTCLYNYSARLKDITITN